MTIARGRSENWRRIAAAVCAAAALGAAPARAQIELDRTYDTSLPIEITADTLEVQQDLQLAIFQGNVDAVQGELRLRADQLTVHYRTGEGGESTISLIEAKGKVVLSSPTEMAQGDEGVYDVDADTIELVGSVVLNRGDNIISGDRLKLNLATGKSKMESGVGATGGRQRVKALIVPKSVPQ